MRGVSERVRSCEHDRVVCTIVRTTGEYRGVHVIVGEWNLFGRA